MKNLIKTLKRFGAKKEAKTKSLFIMSEGNENPQENGVMDNPNINASQENITDAENNNDPQAAAEEQDDINQESLVDEILITPGRIVEFKQNPHSNNVRLPHNMESAPGIVVAVNGSNVSLNVFTTDAPLVVLDVPHKYVAEENQSYWDWFTKE